MNDQTCFALYAAESGVGEDRTLCQGQVYHGFLLMRDETPGRDPKIVQELHFVMQTEGLKAGQEPYISPITKQGGRDFESLETYGYIGGTADVMVPIWNKAIDFGTELRRLEVPFDVHNGADAVNCRAGVRAMVEALGLDYAPVLEHHGASAGVDTHLVAQLPESAFDDMPEL